MNVIICKSRDLAGSFQKLKLMLDLESHFRDDQSAVGQSVIYAIQHKAPMNQIVTQIKESIQDNPALMNRILGDDLYDRINEFEVL